MCTINFTITAASCPRIDPWGCTTRTGYFKCREVKTGFYRNISMQTGSSGTLIGWKSGQTTFVPLWDRMEGAWLRTLEFLRTTLYLYTRTTCWLYWRCLKQSFHTSGELYCFVVTPGWIEKIYCSFWHSVKLYTGNSKVSFYIIPRTEIPRQKIYFLLN
jgi:hypothetical protein